MSLKTASVPVSEFQNCKTFCLLLPFVGIENHFYLAGLIFQKFDYLLAELNYKRFMFEKMCILSILSKLKVVKLLIDKYRMHNLYAIFAKLLNICKQIAGNLVNESGNVPKCLELKIVAPIRMFLGEKL